MLKTYRHVHLVGATGAIIRTATFEQREHLVVPIVAMMEGVVWAGNSQAPELVLADRLAIAPSGWNGRPVFYDHPQVDGNFVMGNDPIVLEAKKWGITFNAATSEQVLAKKGLFFEAWLDPERAALVGATEAIERMSAGQSVEVSIGALVVVLEETGEWEGIPYYGVWDEIHSDHLAILPPGVPGACSPEMGCGVRAAKARVHFITASGMRFMPEEPTTMPAPTRTTPAPTRPTPDSTLSLRQRLMKKMGIRIAESVGDSDLHTMLDQALFASEPGYLGIMDVFQDDNQVIYATAPDSSWETWKRGYTLADGVITLATEKTRVEPVTRYEEVAASGAQPTAHPQQPCGCATSRGATTMRTIPERATALIANANNAFVEEHRPFLETLNDAQMTALEGKPVMASQPQPTPAPSPAPAPEPPPAPAPPTVPAQDVTLDTLLAKADPDTRAAFNGIKAAAAAQKAQSIAALKASGRCTFTDAALSAMPQEQLDSMTALAGLTVSSAPVNYAAQDAAARAHTNTNEQRTVPKPASLMDNVRAARGQTVAKDTVQ